MNVFSTMDKIMIFLVVFGAVFCSITEGGKFCLVLSDCVDGKLCCQRVCLHRKACDGLCSSDVDCDTNYGESCSLGKCICERPPCTQETQHRIQCVYSSQCQENQTCKNGVCRNIDSISKTEEMNPVVLGIVATVGLIIFVVSFYLCLRQQKSTRPSLAAKQAKQHQQERERLNEQANMNIENESDSSDRQHTNCKRHSNMDQEVQKKHLGTTHASMDLSVVIEEDEVSEMT